MKWIESIKEIQKAQENNRLVVFVGAGVSKNSGIPTWYELIKKIADEIGYSHCNVCSKRGVCKEEDCPERFSFTQDEFLRIPEYFYNQDHSIQHNAYYQFLMDVLKVNGQPNPIDEEVFSLLPHHIVTTNYDDLLERSSSVNARLYTVVSEDKELLSKASEHYILKMHGDLSKPQTMVLKESDYINYEQEHPLISTFLRSLLINHTFLFLGYSLNDYNLNLIIGWINFFQKANDVKERPKSFLITSSTTSDFEQSRLADRNIEVVDLSAFPGTTIQDANVPDVISNSAGKSLYAFLRCITQPQLFEKYAPFEEMLQEKYEVFQAYRKIAKEDLLRQQRLGRIQFLGTALDFIDQEWFERIRDLIQSENSTLIDAFQRATITEILTHRGPNEDDSKNRCLVPVNAESEDVYERLYVNNDYSSLYQMVEKSDDIASKIYWGVFFGIAKKEIAVLIEKEAQELRESDYISILLHKSRARLALLTPLDRQESRTEELRMQFRTTPPRYEKAVGFLKMLFQSDAENIKKMEEILVKQENRYKYGSTAFHSGHAYMHIWEIQAYAYEYYFFMMDNRLPINVFSEPKAYFAPYLKAILCSYAPVAPESDEDFFGMTHRMPYPLGEVDLDMFVKFTDPKTLCAWLKDYHVVRIEIDSSVNIVLKFGNLCKSLEIGKKDGFSEQLHCFCILCCHMGLEENDRKKVFGALVDVFCDVCKEKKNIANSLIEPLRYLLRFFVKDECEHEKEKLLSELLDSNVYEGIRTENSSMVLDTLNLLSHTISDEKKEWVKQQIETIPDETKRLSRACEWRKLLPSTYFDDLIKENITKIGTEWIYELLWEKRIDFSESIFNEILKDLETEHAKQRNHPNVRSFPDYLLGTIERCIILKLIGYDLDINRLKLYEQYSDHLRFMLDPQSFDYGLVDTRHYMWQNLIRSDVYRPAFVEHKKEILSEQLEETWKKGLETAEQQRIVYGILLDDDELMKFGRA